MEDGAQAQETQAAQKQGEADTLRQAAAAQRTDAQVLDQRAALREKDATPWRTLAQRFRSRIIEPPKNFIQRLLNALYRAIADRSEAVANAISAEAGRLRVQAEALREAAGLKEQEAHAREAEATALLAEATEAKEEADLRTAADTFTAQAQAAETLAAEYRALAENPPSSQTVTHYLHDPEGRLLGEYDEAGQVEREYVYLDHLPLAQISGTTIAYIHTDHLGTPESLTDQGQAIVWQAHHDPFGQTTVTTQAVEHNLRFPGQYFDAETGLHYNYFRDYDPSIGRYVQSDPIGLTGRLNTYAYAQQNPLSLVDPFGLDPSRSVRGGPRIPGPPTDVFSPGTPTNKAFVDSTTRALNELFGDDDNVVVGPWPGSAKDPVRDDDADEGEFCPPSTPFPESDDDCREQWIADTKWCDQSFTGRANQACHDWAQEEFYRCKAGEPSQPFRL
ncbi:MAG: RHS repeat-associated core domain-containing protein [Gammaproteobacteria bacterium]